MEVEQELADADRCHDQGRMARLRNEKGTLGLELARAYGLAGRNDVNTSRKSVSMAVTQRVTFDGLSGVSESQPTDQNCQSDQRDDDEGRQEPSQKQ